MRPFSIIDQGLCVEGDIEAGGRLVIRGTLRGRLRADHVVIARDGLVHGQVAARRVDVAGTLEGDVDVGGSIQILATGCCRGQVRCQTLQMAAGAVLNAAVTCGRRSEDGQVKVKAER